MWRYSEALFGDRTFLWILVSKHEMIPYLHEAARVQGEETWEMCVEDACTCRNQDFIEAKHQAKSAAMQCHEIRTVCGITKPDALLGIKSGLNPRPMTIVKVSAFNVEGPWKRDLNTVSLRPRIPELSMKVVPIVYVGGCFPPQTWLRATLP